MLGIPMQVVLGWLSNSELRVQTSHHTVLRMAATTESFMFSLTLFKVESRDFPFIKE